MITGKQRSYLKSLAHDLEPTVYIGKSGITDNILQELDTGFECRELVKVKIQDGCERKPQEVANEIAPKLNAEFVQAIGKKFTLYRASKNNKQIELPRK